MARRSLLLLLGLLLFVPVTALAEEPPPPRLVGGEPPKAEEPPKAVEPPKAAEPAPPDPAKTPAMKADVDAAKADALKAADAAKTDATTAAHKYSDIAWLLVASALVMLMMPGLALFYGGMARRKNVLGTMMHTMVALGLVGVQWVVIGYSLAFGKPAIEIAISETDVEQKGPDGKVLMGPDGKPVTKKEPLKGGVVGYSPELVCLGATAAVPVKEEDIYKRLKIDPATATDEQKKKVADELANANRFNTFPNTNLPLYLHAMFQGMFAIITVALISGAFAERVKFGTFCLFALIWTTVVYDPLAHMVWSFQWATDAEKGLIPLDPANGKIAPAAGLLGVNGAIDFAGGTVVHIAAGFSGLAAILLLRKRVGFGKQTFHPNSIVLTLLGAGLLWFGWFGFNGGSALYANGQAVSAFAVTQIAAAAASLAWMLVEWVHRGKPTALGFASGLVAGLVAITPASGFVAPGGALAIGLAAGLVCYLAVAAKGLLGYDDSLDAFGIHGVGGLLGAILTAFFVSLPLWVYGSEMPAGAFPGKTDPDEATKTIVYNQSAQILWQIKASAISAVYAFVVTAVLVLLLEYTIGFTLKEKDEAVGLDLSQHGEVGVDVGPDVDAATVVTALTPRPAAAPPAQTNGESKRFSVVVEGVSAKDLHAAWSALCQVGEAAPPPEFTALYKYVTTVSGNKFRFRGGDPAKVRMAMQKLLEKSLPDTPVQTHVEH